MSESDTERMITMKKLLAMLLCTSALALTACNSEGNTSSSNVSSNSSTRDTSISESVSSVSASADSSTEKLDRAETYDKIQVTMELDEVMSQAIVSIENESNYIFDGSVSVYFNDSTGMQRDSDVIFVEELTPGNFTYARIDLDDVYTVHEMEYRISDKATFVPAPATDHGTMDEEASKQLSSDFETSFGGAGNPEYATSWYHFATSVEVYDSSDGKYAQITVSSDADSESIDRIGNTIFANYVYAKNYDIDLVSVKVITEDGTQVFLRTL